MELHDSTKRNDIEIRRVQALQGEKTLTIVFPKILRQDWELQKEIF